MAKIKITQKEQEIEGKLVSGEVKPFGTSAHIPFRKEHTGKVINVVIPNDPQYVWVFDKNALTRLCNEALKHVTDGKTAFIQRSTIENVRSGKFMLHELEKTMELVKSSNTLKKDIQRIKASYNL